MTYHQTNVHSSSPKIKYCIICLSRLRERQNRRVYLVLLVVAMPIGLLIPTTPFYSAVITPRSLRKFTTTNPAAAVVFVIALESSNDLSNWFTVPSVTVAKYTIRVDQHHCALSVCVIDLVARFAKHSKYEKKSMPYDVQKFLQLSASVTKY